MLPLSATSFPRLVSLSLHELSLPRNIAECMLAVMLPLKAVAISGLCDLTTQDNGTEQERGKYLSEWQTDCGHNPLEQERKERSGRREEERERDQ